MNAKPQFSILFVCLGNICRSPLAEGVFRDVVAARGLTNRFVVDSAGTGAWHEGDLPDPRSIEVAAKYGVNLTDQRARKIKPGDFSGFTHILGMDLSNVEKLQRAAPVQAAASIHLFLEFATGHTIEIPDPYYGGPDGFDRAYRTIREASALLVDKLV